MSEKRLPFSHPRWNDIPEAEVIEDEGDTDKGNNAESMKEFLAFIERDQKERAYRKKEKAHEKKALERHKRKREVILAGYEQRDGVLDRPDLEKELHNETQRFLKELKEIRDLACGK